MELRQSPEWGKYLESLGWATETIEGCAVRIRRMGPVGSIIKIQRPQSLPLEKIDEVAQRNRALFVKIEPISSSQLPDLNAQLYKPDSWPLTPSRTVMLDLKKTSSEILKSFSKDTRQAIKKALGENISPIVYSSSSQQFSHALEIFYDLLKQTGKERGFWLPPFKELRTKAQSFGNHCFLILTFKTDEKMTAQPPLLPLSGILVLVHDQTAYYHHAASTKLGQLLKAPYLALWEAIKTAASAGCERLDLEGIFDPRFPSMFKKWINFSTFKLKWGGEVVEFPPPLTKVYHPLVKLLFSLAK